MTIQPASLLNTYSSESIDIDNVRSDSEHYPSTPMASTPHMVFYEHCHVIDVQIRSNGEVFVYVEVQDSTVSQPETSSWWVPYTDCFFRGTYGQLNRSANIIGTMRRASGILPAKEQCADLLTYGYAITGIRTMLLEMLADAAANSAWIATAIQQSTPDQLTNLNVLTELIPSRLVSNLQAHPGPGP